ncbi:type II secretion system minor pseudopilin GspJ [Acinetobacter sp. ANC 4558]|uniref:type II secretion system minor pseudopilin GspJ n=1 Tax=Acinetobacter sp. ANC 4558 TaxID=1977876 RepID=UPI0026B83E05
MIKMKQGFTLIELLIAIAIFAVLSALGWKVFDHVAHVKERNIQREQVLGELQTAYQILLKDSVQIVPIKANVNHNVEAALVLQNGNLTFSKSGVVDPLLQGRPPFERIEYRYDEDNKSITRLRYQNLNRNNNEKPEKSVFLDNVDELNMTVLDPEELMIWPKNDGLENRNNAGQQVLPKGLKFVFSRNGTQYEWLFSLLNTEHLLK